MTALDLLVCRRADGPPSDHRIRHFDTRGGVLPLAKTLLAALLHARAAGPKPWILDRDVSPLSFASGHRLFGVTPETGVLLLGTWGNVPGEPVDPLAVPGGATRPVAAFPSTGSLSSRRATKALRQGRCCTGGRAASKSWLWRGCSTAKSA